MNETCAHEMTIDNLVIETTKIKTVGKRMEELGVGGYNF